MATARKMAVKEIAPLGGATLGGYKLGWLETITKDAINDTIEITNATLVDTAVLQIKASGVAEPNTISANVITLTSATGTDVKGLIIYK
jgi:hypothetical protein